MSKEIKRKPIIGILPSVEPTNKMTKVNYGYTHGIIKHGGIPMIFTFVEDEADIQQMVDMCDAFLFVGGVDVNPALYGEEKFNDTVDWSIERDHLEAPVVRMAMAQNKPIMGVCRGIQIINATLGGTLYQDLPVQNTAPNAHVHSQKVGYPEGGHNVDIVKGTLFHELFGVDKTYVNTYHHQSLKDIAPGFTIGAYGEDGIVEAIYMKDRPHVFAVQWHPELIREQHDCSDKLFEYFMKCAYEQIQGR